ncbi:hypothetical protein T484DRAFT_1886112 [Baffinella frigidus]|nr:hypothetical protein T484DRAFT_2025229 [Cryptophyta sp. CCMP2293]KAJ1489250.1 hypothetical protein T484DRAFT_1886112 [Cryptophyta sp. CCMP2293]
MAHPLVRGPTSARRVGCFSGWFLAPSRAARAQAQTLREEEGGEVSAMLVFVMDQKHEAGVGARAPFAASHQVQTLSAADTVDVAKNPDGGPVAELEATSSLLRVSECSEGQATGSDGPSAEEEAHEEYLSRARTLSSEWGNKRRLATVPPPRLHAPIAYHVRDPNTLLSSRSQPEERLSLIGRIEADLQIFLKSDMEFRESLERERRRAGRVAGLSGSCDR